MGFYSNCRRCEEFISHRGKYCSYENCSLLKQSKIYPKKITQEEIAMCLQNNIGIIINKSSMATYARKIKKYLKKGDENTILRKM